MRIDRTPNAWLMGRERITAQRSSSKGVKVDELYVLIVGVSVARAEISSCGRQYWRELGERRTFMVFRGSVWDGGALRLDRWAVLEGGFCSACSSGLWGALRLDGVVVLVVPFALAGFWSCVLPGADLSSPLLFAVVESNLSAFDSFLVVVFFEGVTFAVAFFLGLGILGGKTIG